MDHRPLFPPSPPTIQTIVEPFGQVGSQDELARQLDEAFAQADWLNQRGASMMMSQRKYKHFVQENDRLPLGRLGCQRQRLIPVDELQWEQENRPPGQSSIGGHGFGGAGSAGRPIIRTDNNGSYERAASLAGQLGAGAASGGGDSVEERLGQVGVCSSFADCMGHQLRLASGKLFGTSQPVLLMDKRQLVQALNESFLGELRGNLVERLHEFTDCPYVKHEHRQLIVSLLTCVKVLLNKFVKLIYRLVSIEWWRASTSGSLPADFLTERRSIGGKKLGQKRADWPSGLFSSLPFSL